MTQVESLCYVTVVQRDIKATAHSDKQLLQFSMAVFAPRGTRCYVVKVIDALDLEGNMITALNKAKAASRVSDLRELYEPASVETAAIRHL